MPGDILFLQEGDKISADGVIISVSELLVDESILTGESEPLVKSALQDAVEKANIARSRRYNIEGQCPDAGDPYRSSYQSGQYFRVITVGNEQPDTDAAGATGLCAQDPWLALGIGLIFFIIGLAIGNLLLDGSNLCYRYYSR